MDLKALQNQSNHQARHHLTSTLSSPQLIEQYPNRIICYQSVHTCISLQINNYGRVFNNKQQQHRLQNIERELTRPIYYLFTKFY